MSGHLDALNPASWPLVCSRRSARSETGRDLWAAFLSPPLAEEALHDLGGLRRELLRQAGVRPGWWCGLVGTGVDGSRVHAWHRHQLEDLIAIPLGLRAIVGAHSCAAPSTCGQVSLCRRISAQLGNPQPASPAGRSTACRSGDCGFSARPPARRNRVIW